MAWHIVTAANAGEYDLAVESLAKAQARLPQHDPQPCLEVGQAFVTAGKLKDAEACLENASETSRPTPGVHCLRAQIHQAGHSA